MKAEPIIEGQVESPKTSTEFEKRYVELCKETGYQIVFTPVYLKRDDGTYSTQIQVSIGELPKAK